MISRPYTVRLVKALTLVVALFALSVACRKKEKKEPDDPKPVFDKQAMLVNYADNLVIPAFQNLDAGVKNMDAAWKAFVATPDTTRLRELRLAFFAAYTTYQRAGIYGFGPGEDKGIRINFNIFPSDTTAIEKNISGGSYNLSTIANQKAKGFPALEYLFYGYQQSDETVVTRLSAAGRQAYVNDLIGELLSLSGQMNSTWTSSYRTTFVNSLGTDVGSSIGFLINQLNFELDYLKNAKLATPVGLRSAGVPHPDNAEAFYSGRSMELVKETFNVIENVYLGRSFSGNNGSGFDDYIVHLGSQHVNGPLHNAIVAQFDVARNAIKVIPDPLSTAVINNKASVENAYKELVKLLALLKTDLPSNLGVMITYQDGDGD